MEDGLELLILLLLPLGWWDHKRGPSYGALLPSLRPHFSNPGRKLLSFPLPQSGVTLMQRQQKCRLSPHWLGVWSEPRAVQYNWNCSVGLPGPERAFCETCRGHRWEHNRTGRSGGGSLVTKQGPSPGQAGTQYLSKDNKTGSQE